MIARYGLWVPLRSDTLSLGLADSDRVRLQAATLDPCDKIRPSRHTDLVTCSGGRKRKRRHRVKVPKRGKRRHENAHIETLLRNNVATAAAEDNHPTHSNLACARVKECPSSVLGFPTYLD
jgi:hypothetical protein